MSTLTSRPLSLLHVEFHELYARHLCRHSQFGINVVHLAALAGVWYGVYGVVYRLAGSEWVLVGLAGAYLAVIAANVPARVLAATGLFLALFLAALLWLPRPPAWACVLMVPVCYKLQAWSHKVFTAASDMTEFDKKYRKGIVLSVVLLFYEIPILLNYLLFDRSNWRA